MAQRRLLTVASTLKIILAVGGIFVAGTVTGGFISLRVADHLAQQRRAQERNGPGDIGVRLTEQLQLTPEQNEKIRPIINRTTDELRKVRREAFSQTAALVAKMDADISNELTVPQRELLKDIRLREEERRKKWMAERTKRNDARPPGAPGDDPVRPPGPPPAP
jgi:Spy/CpxP family protein refolding chaperone